MDLDKTLFYLNLSALKETLKFDNTGQKESPGQKNGYLKPVEEETTQWRWRVDVKSDNLCIIMNMERFLFDLLVIITLYCSNLDICKYYTKIFVAISNCIAENRHLLVTVRKNFC